MTTSTVLSRTLTAAVGVAVLGLAAAPAASATDRATSLPAAPPPAVAGIPVPGGGTVTGPTAVPAPPADLAAGEVCAFPVHLTFPRNEQQAWTYTDASGRTVAQYIQGALTGVITRTDTGRSVTRALNGRGVFTDAADGSSALTGYGSALIGFHVGDTPSHQLVVLDPHGVAQVRISADGHRALVFGGGEDLCRTLA